MEGSLDSPELYGVIPRSAQAIFEHLRQPQYKEQVVTCSYLEIYNEELRDLLLENGGGGAHGGGQKLDIMEGKDGTFCRYVDWLFDLVVGRWLGKFVFQQLRWL